MQGETKYQKKYSEKLPLYYDNKKMFSRVGTVTCVTLYLYCIYAKKAIDWSFVSVVAESSTVDGIPDRAGPEQDYPVRREQDSPVNHSI